METATDTNTSANKRTRFDATAQSGNEHLSPLALSLGHIRSHVESLRPETQHILVKIGTDYIKLRQKAALKERRITKMSSDEDYIPNSARLKFELKVSNEACMDPEYTSLVDETKILIETFQQDLKKYIVKAAIVELNVFKAKASESLATGLFVLAKTILIVSGQNDLNPHQIVNTILDRHHESLLFHLQENLDSFRTLYKTTNKVAALPDALLATGAADYLSHHTNSQLLTQDSYTANPPPRPNPQTPRAEQCISNMYRAIDSIFVQAWNIFLQAQDTNDRRLELKKFTADLLLLQSTEETQMDLDDEPTLAQTSVHDLIHKKTTEQTKGLKAEMSSLKKLVKDLQSPNGSKNQTRGPSGASKQKQKAQGRNQSRKPAAQKADGAANDSKPANKKKSTSKSKNRSHSKNKRSNTKQSKS
jgi:hypothetical protein